MTTKTKLIDVQIVSPNGLVYANTATKCQVQSVRGGLTILPNHIAMMTALDISPVIVTTGDPQAPEDYIAINGGLLEVRDNELTIIANMAIRASDINDAAIQMEKTMAEDAMNQAKIDHDIRAYQMAELDLKKALNQLDVIKHHRHQ